jgi:hypothetical protein
MKRVNPGKEIMEYARKKQFSVSHAELLRTGRKGGRCHRRKE